MEKIKKEWITEWSDIRIELNDSAPEHRKRFFLRERDGTDLQCKVVYPDGIDYFDMTPFRGRRTRVTIETI